MNYSSANIQGWQSFSFTWATFLNCHEGFIRPFFHLSSASFYHLIWKQGAEVLKKFTTPSAKYLREHLLYAKLDDELWELLQDAESREYIKQSIIRRYLTE